MDNESGLVHLYIIAYYPMLPDVTRCYPNVVREYEQYCLKEQTLHENFCAPFKRTIGR